MPLDFFVQSKNYDFLETFNLYILSDSYISKNMLCTKNERCGFWLYVTNVTVTYVMPFFERLNRNSIFECFDDLHFDIRWKHTCVQTWKQSIQAYKNHIFAETWCTFSVRTAVSKKIDVLDPMLSNYKFLEVYIWFSIVCLVFLVFFIAFFKSFQRNNATSMYTLQTRIVFHKVSKISIFIQLLFHYINR